jgi:serine/threonine protein kinase
MHSQNIAHRDIKLENILIGANQKIKIIDFGFSVHIHNKKQEIKLLCGTPCYMAPELVTNKR